MNNLIWTGILLIALAARPYIKRHGEDIFPSAIAAMVGLGLVVVGVIVEWVFSLGV